MSRMTRLTVALLIGVCPAALRGSECEQTPRAPVKISGAFCGRVFDQVGPIGPVELHLIDEAGHETAVIDADSNTNFKFPALPKGKYRLEVQGFILAQGEIELTNARAPACTRPVSVHVEAAGEPCGTWIEDRRPPRD